MRKLITTFFMAMIQTVKKSQHSKNSNPTKKSGSATLFLQGQN